VKLLSKKQVFLTDVYTINSQITSCLIVNLSAYTYYLH